MRQAHGLGPWRKRWVWTKQQVSSLGLANTLGLKMSHWRLRSLSRGALVRLHVPGADVYCRAQTTDRRVFTQIFVAREYRCLDHVRDARLIVDCGANVGYSSAYFLARFPTAQLIAVEPDPQNFQLLRKNLEPFRNRVTLINSAVWSKPADLVIANPGAEEWAFTVREARAGESAAVRGVELGTLLERSGHERISILKVDIEGSEAEVFREAPWIDKVDHLVIELHSPECERVVYGAVGDRASVSRCEELTVFDFTARRATGARARA